MNGATRSGAAPDLLAWLLLEAIPFLRHGQVRRRLRTCPVCGKRSRLPDGAQRCAVCVAEAIAECLDAPVPPRRWARDWDACQACGRTRVAHAAHGLCRSCYNREQRRRA